MAHYKILFNHEIWYNMKDSDIASFVTLDQYIIKGLVNSNAKTPCRAYHGCILCPKNKRPGPREPGLLVAIAG